MHGRAALHTLADCPCSLGLLPCFLLPLRALPPPRKQVVYCASVGSYFKGGQLTPIDLIVENHFHR